MSTGFKGTFSDNKRPVIATAPDALVYINGELAIPSGGNPNRRVNVQPLVTSISVQLGVEQSPGTAQVSLQIPKHYREDFFRGGQLILTNMMEVRIYMKGHFSVGGTPRYYPVFWGVVTSVNHTWSGGEQSVDLSCQDVLYWWTIQRININPSLMGADTPTQGNFNIKGSGIFTGVNPFDTMYSLSRYAYGDAVIQQNYLQGRQTRNEPNSVQNARLMYYWTRQWGRVAYALRMYGPQGDLLQGGLLAAALSQQNRQAAFQGKLGKGKRSESKKFKFNENIDLTQISAFSEIASRIGSFDLHTSEFQTKKEIADTTKKAIGYEFFMDVTGELIFKPPFYNLDVIPNKPVSWIRPIDIINENYAENVPDVTFLEATGSSVRNFQVANEEILKPKATYIDYRLVQKYGWKPGSYNSEFFGAGLDGQAPRNLFYHLVDELDRQNVRIHSGSLTIPIRPELRLGYPIYHEEQDAYYYVEAISHQFTYAGQCTTSLTLSARRTKFYASFPYWNETKVTGENAQGPADEESRDTPDDQPPAGQTAPTGVYPNNIYNRPINAFSGDPEPDKNVILTAVERSEEEKEESGETNETHDNLNDETKSEQVTRDLISLRTQFRVFGPNDYVYQIDPNRSEPVRYNQNGQKTSGPLTSIVVENKTLGGRTNTIPTLPVSDERGYEVIGEYEYGRTISLTRNGLDFTRQSDRRSRALANLRPSRGTTEQLQEDIDEIDSDPLSTNAEQSEDDRVAQIDPNNYGQRLLEVQPRGPQAYNNIDEARRVVKGRDFRVSDSGLLVPESDRSFKKNTQVAKWLENGTIDRARQRAGVSAEQYPDSLILGMIHTESSGRADARRTNEDGKLSQFCGLLQIGNDNAEFDNKENTDFLGTGPDDVQTAEDSIVHFLKYSENKASAHQYDPDRIAINWKGGPGTLDEYNRLVDGGASNSTVVGFLNERWGTDTYVAHSREARQVWGDESAAVVEVPEEELEINQFGNRPVDASLANTASNKLFATALEENLAKGQDTLPSNIQPIRDPGLMTEITSFLEEIYAQGFEEEREIEKELRGENSYRVRTPTQADRPSAPEPEDENLVDTPLGRPEVQRALDDGQSASEVFGSDGVWKEVEKNWRQKNSEFEESGESFEEGLSNLNPFDNDDEDDS